MTEDVRKLEEMTEAPEEKAYPCEPFDFACPNRDECKKGEECPWHEE